MRNIHEDSVVGVTHTNLSLEPEPVRYQQKSQNTQKSELAVISLHGHAMLFSRIGT
jgi:hypothetical protein